MNNLEKRKLIKKLKKGDVINTVARINKKNIFEFIKYKIAITFIVLTQKIVFGRKSNYFDSHTVIYFNKNKIFSVHPPKAEFITLDELIENSKQITVYRYNASEFEQKDINYIEKECNKFVKEEKEYDIGQLVDILMNTIAGFPYKYKVKWFDQGRGNKVCSVGVAAMFTKWRHWAKKQNKNRKIPRLFSKLNKKAWSKRFIKKFEKNGGKWNVEETFPANFANTEQMFNKEFKKIYTIKY